MLTPMPALENHHDLPAEALNRLAQDDPWAMYLVVRYQHPFLIQDLLAAGAEATIRCYDEWADTDSHREAFAAWRERSFRKIALRADEKQWSRLLEEFDCTLGCVDGEPVVACLPPLRKSERPQLLKRLQAYSPEAKSVLANKVEAPFIELLINGSVEMSAGKMLAQVAHGALMCVWSQLRDQPALESAWAAWAKGGQRCQVRRLSGYEWRLRVERGDCVVVRDGGLTEVAAGSQTVAAFAPRL